MSDSVLEFNKLVKSFDGVSVLKGITAEVKTGEVIGLLGLNGAGKTTLLETALGFAKPESGSALLWGKDSANEASLEAKTRIGFVPQQDELIETITGKQYLALISKFYPGWNHALIDRLALEWLVPLDTRISKQSIGQRQKLSILAALGHEPELIVLDEPVASLDPVARRQFLKELVEIASTHSRTILFSTHIVSDLERVASRVWLMKEGHIVIDETLDELKEHNAKIHIPPGITIPESFLNTHGIHSRMEQNTQVLFLSNYREQLVTELQQHCSQPLEITSLSLEDIFLELHT